jgi:hypothetical protein
MDRALEKWAKTFQNWAGSFDATATSNIGSSQIKTFATLQPSS